MRTKLILFLFLSASIAIAQEKLSNISTPTSPASSILGLQPEVILKPKSYQALETALYSNFTGENKGLTIPNDFSLEFSPYWTKNHSLTLEEYLFPKSIKDQIIRNSSFSLASTQNFILGDSSSSNSIAFGYRSTIYIGNKKDRDEVINYKSNLANEQKIQAYIGAEATRLVYNNKVKNKSEFINEIKDFIYKVINDNTPSLNNNQKLTLLNDIIIDINQLEFNINNTGPFLDKFYNLIYNKLRTEEIINKFKKYIDNRLGWSIDLAYANFINFPNNNFNFSYLPRHSIWITPTYRFKEKLNFLRLGGVLRYEWYNFSYFKRYFSEIKIYENNLDYGLSVSSEFKKFTFKIELIGRNSETEIPAGTDSEGNELFRRDQSSDLQYLGSFSYSLTDQLMLSYTFGKKFEPIFNINNTVVSLLALNFGFGAPTDETIDLK